MKLNFLKKGFGILVSIVFIVLIFNQIDIKASLAVMKQVNVSLIAIAIPVYLSAFILRGIRWRTILLNEDIESLYSLISSIFIGYMANSLLPARMGEVYRAHVLGKKENLPRVKVFASIVLERIFDGLVLFAMLTGLIILFYHKPWLIKLATVIGSLFCGSLLFLFVFKYFYNKPFWINSKFIDVKKRLASFKMFAFFITKIENLISSFTDGLEVFNSPKSLLNTVVLTILIWLIEGFTMYLIIKSFGLHVGFLSSIFVLAISSFSTMIPSGPASIGPYQYGYIAALSVFNINQEVALAVSLVNQIFVILLVCIIGFLASLYNHVNINQLENEIESFSN